MALRNQRICDCCGCFTESKTLCGQCLHAGCDRKKKGQRCYLASGASAPKPHTLPPAEEIKIEETQL